MQSLWKGKLVRKEGAMGKEKKGKEKKVERKNMGGYHNAMENIKIAEEILKSHVGVQFGATSCPRPTINDVAKTMANATISAK
jgi:hypothetical protein